MKEADAIIRETREMIDPTHRNVTGKPACDDAVMLSLATQVHLLRKKVAALERANAVQEEEMERNGLGDPFKFS